MPSAALSTWRGMRAAHLDRLRVAHTALRGSLGHRSATEEVNHALVVRLAAEFQGFARDLHDEAAGVVVSRLAPNDVALQGVLQSLHTSRRRLDRGNAAPASLGEDFGVFGIQLWDELQAVFPRSAVAWRSKLGLLNEARNGVAHDDAAKVARVAGPGWPVNLRSVDRWRNALDGLAQGMDHVTGRHVQRMFGVVPW